MVYLGLCRNISHQKQEQILLRDGPVETAKNFRLKRSPSRILQYVHHETLTTPQIAFFEMSTPKTLILQELIKILMSGRAHLQPQM